MNTGLFINNEFVAGAHTIETINPTTGKVIAAVQAGMSISQGFHIMLYQGSGGV